MAKLTLAEANGVVEAGLRAAEEKKVGMAIAVVDSAAELVAFARADTAPWIVSEIAWRKARTSAAFSRPTLESEKMWAERPFFAQSVMALGNYVVGRGAVPLYGSDGEIIGAVGASGGHPDQDHSVAEEAAKALQRG